MKGLCDPSFFKILPFFFSFFLSIDFASCYFRCYCTFKCVGNRKGSREVISFCNARWVLVASFRGNGFHVHVFFIHAKNRGWCEWLIFWFEQNLKKKKKIVTISLFCFTELRDIQRNLTKSKCLKYTWAGFIIIIYNNFEYIENWNHSHIVIISRLFNEILLSRASIGLLMDLSYLEAYWHANWNGHRKNIQ